MTARSTNQGCVTTLIRLSSLPGACSMPSGVVRSPVHGRVVCLRVLLRTMASI